MLAMSLIFGLKLFIFNQDKFIFMKLSSFREHLANEKERLVDLGSDQTSCHNPYQGGYYPVQVN